MKPLLFLSIIWLAAAAGALDCLVMPTAQDGSMDWWYAVPRGFTPKLSRRSTAPTGEYFRVIPFYKDFAVDTNGAARITFNLEVVRPDGSIDDSVLGAVAHDGAASAPNLLPSQGVLNICFDEGDPFGEHQIRVTSFDHVAGVTNQQSAAIEHVKFQLPTLSAKELEEIFRTYPTQPNPTKALAAFLQIEQSYFDEENEPIWSAIWFFKTVFERNEYLIPHLLDAFGSGSNKQQRDTILVLALLDELDELPKLNTDLRAFRRVMEAGRVPDPYAEITTGKQLDMLWAEFFATGTVKPIRQIATSLALVEHVGALEKIKNGELDPKELEVYRAGMLEATFQSALWSIRSNRERSPLLFQYLVGIVESDELDERAASMLALLLKSIEQDKDKEDEK